ncbi:MAG: universal stress protein [Nitrosopumilaceae archaeon]|nr:universal stress protein [Nitrosopumilaceae archaeon]
MYKKILVPHGGTSAGDNAVRHAIHLAKVDSAKIILLHVVESLQIPPTFALSETERKKLIQDIDGVSESLKSSMEEKLEQQIAICKENGINADKLVLIGDAAEEILRVVMNDKIDLIVMSKRRKLKGLRKLLSLGSVSRKIVEHVTCPVYLIDVESS